MQQSYFYVQDVLHHCWGCAINPPWAEADPRAKLLHGG